MRPPTRMSSLPDKVDPAPQHRNAAGACNPLSGREQLFDKDEGGDRGHPYEAHNAAREQERHQKPAAAETEKPVLHPHPHCARAALPPMIEDEVEGGAAMRQTDRFQWGELVTACGNDDDGAQ